jgi:hypothetical protein
MELRIALISVERDHAFVEMVYVGEFVRESYAREINGNPFQLGLGGLEMRLIYMGVTYHMD